MSSAGLVHTNFAALVPGVDEVSHGAATAAPDRLSVMIAKKPRPGSSTTSASGSSADGYAGSCPPLGDVGVLVRRVVIGHDMQLAARVGLGDQLEELALAVVAVVAGSLATSNAANNVVVR